MAAWPHDLPCHKKWQKQVHRIDCMTSLARMVRRAFGKTCFLRIKTTPNGQMASNCHKTYSTDEAPLPPYCTISCPLWNTQAVQPIRRTLSVWGIVIQCMKNFPHAARGVSQEPPTECVWETSLSFSGSKRFLHDILEEVLKNTSLTLK